MGRQPAGNAAATCRDEDGGTGRTRRKGLPMTASSRWILGLARVRPGDRIEAWEHRQPRFTGTVSDDGSTITGRWEAAEDGIHFVPDFDLVYRRVPPQG